MNNNLSTLAADSFRASLETFGIDPDCGYCGVDLYLAFSEHFLDKCERDYVSDIVLSAIEDDHAEPISFYAENVASDLIATAYAQDLQMISREDYAGIVIDVWSDEGRIDSGVAGFMFECPEMLLNIALEHERLWRVRFIDTTAKISGYIDRYNDVVLAYNPKTD